jgi:hypothetical protein
VIKEGTFLILIINEFYNSVLSLTWRFRPIAKSVG